MQFASNIISDKTSVLFHTSLLNILVLAHLMSYKKNTTRIPIPAKMRIRLAYVGIKPVLLKLTRPSRKHTTPDAINPAPRKFILAAGLRGRSKGMKIAWHMILTIPMEDMITHMYCHPIFWATIPDIRAPTMEPIGIIIEESEIAMGSRPCWTRMKLAGIREGTISPRPTADKDRSTRTIGKDSANCLMTNRKLNMVLMITPANMMRVEPNFSDSFPVIVMNTMVTIVSILRTQEASYDETPSASRIACRFVLTCMALMDYISIGTAVTIDNLRGGVDRGLNLILSQAIWDVGVGEN